MGLRNEALSRGALVAMAGAISAAAVLGLAAVSTLAISATGSEAWRIPFLLICHGKTERAFELAGHPMTLCARCTGVYAGLLLGGLSTLLLRPRRARVLRWIAVAALAPMIVDGIMQTLGVWSTGAPSRALTGLAFGAGLMLLVRVALEDAGPVAPDAAEST